MERGRARQLQHIQQSPYSHLPFPAADLLRHKKQLQECIKDRCLDEELADAYESLGLGQLFLGNYVEAASNLDCACLAQGRSIATDDTADHPLRLKFWVSISCYS